MEYVKTLPEEVLDKLAKEVETLTMFYLFETHNLFNFHREGTRRSLRQNSTLNRRKLSAKRKRSLAERGQKRLKLKNSSLNPMLKKC